MVALVESLRFFSPPPLLLWMVLFTKHTFWKSVVLYCFVGFTVVRISVGNLLSASNKDVFFPNMLGFTINLQLDAQFMSSIWKAKTC